MLSTPYPTHLPVNRLVGLVPSAGLMSVGALDMEKIKADAVAAAEKRIAEQQAGSATLGQQNTGELPPWLVGLRVGLLVIGVGLLGVQLYAGQKIGRSMKMYPGDPGSGWGWFWAGLGGPVGAGVLGFKRSGADMSERIEFLKKAI